MNMRPDYLPNRKGASLIIGDSVPKPLGFSAFPPEWLFSLGRLAPPRHSGRWVGARVASLRSPILRPGHGEVYSPPAQAARARARILFHWPCKVVTELTSGKETGTR